LFNEGVLAERAQLRRVSYCVDRDVGEEQRYNIVNVEVAGALSPADIAPLERHFSMTSACGVCGRATLDALAERGNRSLPDGPLLAPSVLQGLPATLRAAQRLFEATGGLHAAGLFTSSGRLVAAREDVGRHNALDKLAGWALMEGLMPLSGHVVMVSGRSSFELVQKTISMGAAALCSVSAPSSLAVHLADRFNLTLVGFLREQRFNIYAGAERLSPR
jgi:FdhD protein